MRHHTAGNTALLLLLLIACSAFSQTTSSTVSVASVRQVRLTTSGAKWETLRTTLLNFNICPTHGTLALLEKLNPQLLGRSTAEEGTSLIIPLLNEVSGNEQEKLQALLNEEVSASKTGSALFLINSRSLRTIISIWLRTVHEKTGLRDLRDIDLLLQKVLANTNTRLKKYHTDILNSEMDRVTKFLLEIGKKSQPEIVSPWEKLFSKERGRNGSIAKFSDRDIAEIASYFQNVGDKAMTDTMNAAYIHSFKNYFYQIVEPYYAEANSTGMNRTFKSGSGLASVKAPFRFYTDNGFPPTSKAIDVWIHVNIPVLSQNKIKYVDSMDQYWVYCLSEFQFDNLSQRFLNMSTDDKRNMDARSLQSVVAIADLERTKAICPSPASVTVKRIDVRFPYHFIVVSLNKKEIIVHDWIDLAKYAFQLKDGQYGLGLYKTINAF